MDCEEVVCWEVYPVVFSVEKKKCDRHIPPAQRGNMVNIQTIAMTNMSAMISRRDL